MLSLILAILFGLSITFFAFQNSSSVPIVLGGFFFQGVPIYMIVIISALTGILLAWFISAMEGMSHFMLQRQKDAVIKEDKREMRKMEDTIKRLEAENISLKKELNKDESQKDVIVHDDITYKPSFFERIFPSSTRHYSKQM